MKNVQNRKIVLVSGNFNIALSKFVFPIRHHGQMGSDSISSFIINSLFSNQNSSIYLSGMGFVCTEQVLYRAIKIDF